MTTRRSFILSGLAAGLSARAFASSPLQNIAAAECRIEPDQLRQRMDGFGASGAFFQARLLQRYPLAERTRILDLLFSPVRGAGLSIVRNLIGDGGNWGNKFNGPTPSIEPRPGVWNWQGDDDQIWLMRAAARRGCTRFMSTAWSPPAWMKTNHNVVGGRLRTECYQDYAEYLARYVLGYQKHHRLAIYAVSPQNEPDVTVKYSSCYWDAGQYHRFFRDHLVPLFTRHRIPAHLILGEDSTWSDAICRPTLNDPASAAGVDIVAAHAYAGHNHVPKVPISARTGYFSTALGHHKQVWQTEVSAFNPNDASMTDGLYWAKLVHYHLAQDQVSGWLYWWLVSGGPNREALISLDPASQGWLPNRRLFTLGQYSRFIRPGDVRLEATHNPMPGVFTSAYQIAAGNRKKIAVVAINENPQPSRIRFILPGGARALNGWRTSMFEELRPVGMFFGLGVRNADGWLCELMPHSVTTFVAG